MFLYVERFSNDVHRHNLSLDHPDQFPQGLGGIFFQYFQRQFPDLDKYGKEVRPPLRAILAAREPLPAEILRRLFNWQDEGLRDFVRPLSSIFPVTSESGWETIKPYHKSLSDWLTDEIKAGAYFVSVDEGHERLTDYCWAEYRRGGDTLSRYTLRHLPTHLIATEHWNDLEQLHPRRLKPCRRRFNDYRTRLSYDARKPSCAVRRISATTNRYWKSKARWS